jgi:hypothetical protein
VADRYRALLIGNSTYPADEHNLQTLKGPVKDIAALNRALVDSGTGLFADVDVTLLPEVPSTRAIRALGRFFGTATRDDVLLVYFSGHGKLDQSGRLHLCMQDTDSADLLSTAVSSARINEFADASHARNVVIVLDCCHAGAFRGGELGDAMAGLGRYVLTSCRGTQLANDATVENGTSLFTQHLVDGLVQAAADQDGDGYVTFSDLYAYVDRRLREAGKQIPQRRVDGDGDVRLAKRPQPAPAEVTATVPPHGHTAAASDGTTMTDTTATPDRPRPGRARRKLLLAAAAAAAVAIAGGLFTVLVLPGGSGGNPHVSSQRVYSGGSYGFNTPIAVASDGTHVWVANDGGNSVTELNASNGSWVRTPSGGRYGFNNPQAVAADGTHVWVANLSGSVTELNARDGSRVATQSGGRYRFIKPAAVAADGTHVWVPNYGGNSVTELNASNGSWVATLSGGRYRFSNPQGITADGTHVWVANYKGDSVTELPAG